MLGQIAWGKTEMGVTFNVNETEGVQYFYTLDGSVPTSASTEYSGIATLIAPENDEETTVVIKVIGIKEGFLDSTVAEAAVIYGAKGKVETPIINLSKTEASNREMGVVSNTFWPLLSQIA